VGNFDVPGANTATIVAVTIYKDITIKGHVSDHEGHGISARNSYNLLPRLPPITPIR
tara:strand:- start:90 stop:260 length:171 start_codon:yes stop_codon:yes gene_type:complete